MSAGASRSYKNGPKNNWRRTMWNEVLRRTAGREKYEYILYLAGPQDLDRRIAVSKGVPPENLIAIDRDATNVARLRAAGVPVVHGQLLDVLWAWPKDRRVCAVLMDFCGGLDGGVTDALDAMRRPVFADAVRMVNMMRGRDAKSNHWRAALRSLAEGDAFFLGQCYGFSRETLRKHRGAQLVAVWAATILGLARFKKVEQVVTVARWAVGHMCPWTTSYRSSGLLFDSVVLNGECGWLPSAPDHRYEDVARLRRSVAMARRLAAMFAVRTMRQRGILPRKQAA